MNTPLICNGCKLLKINSLSSRLLYQKILINKTFWEIEREENGLVSLSFLVHLNFSKRPIYLNEKDCNLAPCCEKLDTQLPKKVMDCQR